MAAAALLAAGSVVLVSRPRVGLAQAGSGWPAMSRVVVLTGVVSSAGVAAATLPATALVLVAIVAASAAAVLRMVLRRRSGAEADRRAELVLAVCDGMAADLAAGQPPLVTLRRSAQDWPELAPVAAASDMGADVPAAMRLVAQRPGAGQLRTLAASWQVANDAGSGLADAVGRAAAAIRAERRTARLVAAELASARATARMLAVLPLGVLLLGAGVGGDPVGFLVHSPFGLGCLASGLLLCFAGLAWLDRIADQVLRR